MSYNLSPQDHISQCVTEGRAEAFWGLSGVSIGDLGHIMYSCIRKHRPILYNGSVLVFPYRIGQTEILNPVQTGLLRP